MISWAIGSSQAVQMGLPPRAHLSSRLHLQQWNKVRLRMSWGQCFPVHLHTLHSAMQPGSVPGSSSNIWALSTLIIVPACKPVQDILVPWYGHLSSWTSDSVALIHTGKFGMQFVGSGRLATCFTNVVALSYKAISAGRFLWPSLAMRAEAACVP